MTDVPVFLVGLALVGAGGVILAGVAIVAGRRRSRALLDRLDLPSPDTPATPAEAGDNQNRSAEWAVRQAGRVIERLDTRGGMATALARARIPLRVGEYVIVTAAAALVVALVLVVMTHVPALAIGVLVLAPLVSRGFVRFRIKRRRKAFERQLPGALTLIASSLSAGHTFLRAMQMMVEESDPPLSEEFSRVVTESQLGDPVVDALARMAARLDLRDFDWVVQAIRIQQTVGGRLADLLHTLADFIRSRDEIRQEINVLTAEGRISAWVLGGMVPLLMVAVQAVNPTYMQPMYKGWGLVVLAGAGASVVTGTVVILKMVKIDV